MKNNIKILLLFLLPFSLFAQDQNTLDPSGNKQYKEKYRNASASVLKEQIWYYENGKKRAQCIYDKQGTRIIDKEWDESGKLIMLRNLIKERKERGAWDLSFIKWTRKDTVEIFRLKNKNSSKDSFKNYPNTTFGDTVVFHYKCLDTLGYEFDNSYRRNEPLVMIYGVTPFLKSFSDAVATLKERETVYIRIPPQYAYGKEAAGNVPPNTTLVYYIEVIKINEKYKKV